MKKIMMIPNLEELSEDQEKELFDFLENRLDYEIYTME